MACAVFGVVLKEEGDGLKAYGKDGLSVLNHRGEHSHGISFLDSDGLMHTKWGLGLVHGSKIFDAVSGSALIGHTRYITSSDGTLSNAQPIQWSLDNGVEYSISHNGNIANDAEIKYELGMARRGNSDTRAMGTLLGRSLRGGTDVDINQMKRDLGRLVGSYSMAILVGGKNAGIVAVRDSLGYMPLFVGENEDGFFVASEDVAFNRKHFDADCREVTPGEIVRVDRNGVERIALVEAEQRQHCMFQWVYMCSPHSTFAGRNVHVVREDLGRKIAENYRPNVDFVIPVPDSGTVAASGYSWATGIPMRMGLSRGRYEPGRSFLQNAQSDRTDLVRRKLNVVEEVVNGKRVLIIDDSLVRGTTIRRIVSDLRAAGADEVHVAFACPPIVGQCFFGIDFYREELVARSMKERTPAEINREMALRIEADSLYYNTRQDLVKAIGLPQGMICQACLTGEYIQPMEFESAESRKV